MDLFGIHDDIARLGERLRDRGWHLATAESCTGGLIGSTLTDVSGSSDWFRGAVVAYANEVKQELLNVPEQALIEHGAVSEPVVLAMASGVLGTVGAQCSIAVSGIAGPTGGTPDKPVGTVWMAVAAGDRVEAKLHHFDGTRAEVKAQTVAAAVRTLLMLLEE